MAVRLEVVEGMHARLQAAEAAVLLLQGGMSTLVSHVDSFETDMAHMEQRYHYQAMEVLRLRHVASLLEARLDTAVGELALVQGRVPKLNFSGEAAD